MEEEEEEEKQWITMGVKTPLQCARDLTAGTKVWVQQDLQLSADGLDL